MNNHLRITVALTIAAALGMTACSPSSPTPTTGQVSLTIGLTYQPDIQFAPIYVAAQQGLFAKAGVDVTIRHHGANESLLGALQSGEEDVVFAGGDEMMQARSQGIDVVNIATVYQYYPVAVLVPEASPISAAADLRGHSIGLPGEYGENWFALLLLLKEAGLTTSDVTVVSIGYTQQAALMGGKVDAVVGFTNNDAVRFDQAGFPVRPITISPLASQVPELIGAGLGTTSAFLASNTPALKAMWGAIAQAMSICVNDPQQALTATKAYVPGLDQADNAAMALATLQATTPLYGQTADFGQQNTNTWTSMVTFMDEAGLLAGPVKATDAYTTAIVPPIQS